MESQNSHDKVSLENGTLKYNPMISLQEICAVKIVILLWINEKRRELSPFSSNIHVNKWYDEKNNVYSKISELPIPKLIKNISLFRSISDCVEISLKSVFQNDYIISNINENFDNIKWTTKGRVDYKQTILHILQRKPHLYKPEFEIACYYCLEEEVEKMFLTRKGPNILKYSIEKPLTCYFVKKFFGESARVGIRLDEVYLIEQMLQFSFWRTNLLDNQLEAIKYLWNKLTDKDKLDHVVNVVKHCGNIDFRYFILSQLEEEVQQKIISTSTNILTDMLDCWFSIDYFLPTVIHVFDNINANSYNDLLTHLINLITSTYVPEFVRESVEYYRAIFRVFWENSPQHLKESLLNEKYTILDNTFSLLKENVDLAELMLSDLPAAKKEEAILSNKGIRMSAFIIMYYGEWELLNAFFELFLPIEENLALLKDKIMSARGMEIIHHKLEGKKWAEAENFLRWALHEKKEIIELFKCNVMFNRNEFSGKYEIFHADEVDLRYTFVSLANQDFKCIEKLFSKSIL